MELSNIYKPLVAHNIIDNNFVDQEINETQSPLQLTRIDLNMEINRLRTFDNWSFLFIDKHKLALLGFYYYGLSDMVKCCFCDVEIGMWEEGDDVLIEHLKWSPSCSIIQQNPTNNIPIDEDLLKQVLASAPTPSVFDLRTKNTISEGSIEAISEDDVHMYHHQLYSQYGF
jgi:hypothetical protein